MGAGADNHFTVAGGEGAADTVTAEDNTGGGEIRTFDEMHQVIQGAFRVIYQQSNSIT